MNPAHSPPTTHHPPPTTHSFQKNVVNSGVAFVQFMIFFITLLNKAVGRESKDVAGPFADLCGPLMIACMMVMIGVNISLQLKVSSFTHHSCHRRNESHQIRNMNTNRRDRIS